ncbi:MAG: TIGR04211 family SH3 domain-containing protein [Motiliproteus sp.]
MRSTLLLLLVFVSGAVNSAEFHISDEVLVFLHTGPSNQYRIRSNVPSGTMLTVLEHDKATGYSRVRLTNGTDGWVQTKYIDKGRSLAQRLPEVESLLVKSREVVKEQADALNLLEGDLAGANDRQAQFTAETAQLQNEVGRLKLKIDGMDETNLMGWFLRGGALALGGVLVGLILPLLPKRRRRNNDWF